GAPLASWRPPDQPEAPADARGPGGLLRPRRPPGPRCPAPPAGQLAPFLRTAALSCAEASLLSSLAQRSAHPTRPKGSPRLRIPRPPPEPHFLGTSLPPSPVRASLEK